MEALLPLKYKLQLSLLKNNKGPFVRQIILILFYFRLEKDIFLHYFGRHANFPPKNTNLQK